MVIHLVILADFIRVYWAAIFLGKITSVKYSAFFVAGVCLYLIYNNREVKIATILLCISFFISGYHLARHTTNYIPSATVSEKSVVVFINLVIYVYFYSFITRKKTFISHRTWIVLGSLLYPLYLIHNLFGKSLILKTTPMLGEQLSIGIAFICVNDFSLCHKSEAWTQIPPFH